MNLDTKDTKETEEQTTYQNWGRWNTHLNPYIYNNEKNIQKLWKQNW